MATPRLETVVEPCMEVVIPPRTAWREQTHRRGSAAYADPVAACAHVDEVTTEWEPLVDPVCEDCAREGRSDWVSLRRCLSCGHVGCCDSSPGLHATGHHRGTGHPVVQSLQPGHDWAWCYVDEMTLRLID